MEIPELNPNEIPPKSKAPNLPEGCTQADLMEKAKELELRNAVLEESLRVLNQGIDDYIERYNNSRIKESLGSMSPVEYRQSLGLTEA